MVRGRSGWKEGEIGEESLAHLFVDGVPLAEDDVSANETRDKSVEAALLAAASLLLHKEERLVERDVFGEVQSMLPSRAVDGPQPGLPAAHSQVRILSCRGVWRSTHSPRPKRMAIMSACGKRTFTP